MKARDCLEYLDLCGKSGVAYCDKQGRAGCSVQVARNRERVSRLQINSGFL
jgi:hypothetical protein